MNKPQKEIGYGIGYLATFPAENIDKESKYCTGNNGRKSDEDCQPCALYKEFPS